MLLSAFTSKTVKMSGMRKTSLCFCALLVAQGIVWPQTKEAPDRWIGTWKLNALKSRYQAGPLPKSRTLSFETVPGGVKAMSDLLDEFGIVHIEFTGKYDGKDVPMRGGNPGLTISVTRTDSYTFVTSQKTGAKVTVVTHFTVSRDEKTLTASATGTDDSGQKYTNVSVYDRM